MEMGGHFKRILVLVVVIFGVLLVYNWRETAPRTKDESRLEMADSLPSSAVKSVERKTEPGQLRREAMAVENVLLSQRYCGIELTVVAQDMIAMDKAEVPRPFTDERSVVATLWRETFACNPDFAGENCFAARWQVCQRAYEEYGPDGIRVKGLIMAIVKK